MKRQTIGARKASGESENTIRESKRLKVVHNEQYSSNYDFETGSGSDSTEEYINVNGQGSNWKQSMIPVESEIFPNASAQDNNIHNNYLNGSSQSQDDESLKISMNSYSNTSEAENHFPNNNYNLVDNPNMNNSNIADANCHNFPTTSDSNPSQFLDPPAAEIVGTYEAVNVHYTELSEQSSSDRLTLETELEENYGQPPVPENMLECNREDEGLHDTPPDLTPSYSGSEKSRDESTSENDPYNQLSKSEKKSPVAEEIPSTSKSHNDIENVTMCQFKVTQLEGHADIVYSVDSDGDIVLSSSGDTTVKVWNVEESKEVSNFAGHSAAVTSVILLSPEDSQNLGPKLSCSSISRIAVSASYDCHIRLWSVLDGHEISSMYTFNSILCMAILKNCMFAVIGTEGGKLEVWDLLEAKLVDNVYAHDSSVSSVKVQDDYIFSTSKDGAVKVWLFDENEIQPLYTRRRKEAISGTNDFGPAQWQSVAVHGDRLFLGDNSCYLKMLNWRIGRLQLFSNQLQKQGLCETVLVKDNILLSSFFDAKTDTGGINMWQLPEMNYIATMSGELQEICSLSLTHSNEQLRIVSGGHQLLVWDFDFSKPPNKSPQDSYFISELDQVGLEVNDEAVHMSSPRNIAVETPTKSPAENKKSWCNIS